VTTTVPAALEVRGVGKHFGHNWVLKDVDFSIAPGEVVGVIGENGSGKSTLVKLLSGVYTPDAGTVRIGGKDLPMPLRHPQASGIAVIHQDLGLADTLSVADNLGISSSFGVRAFAPIVVRREQAVCRAMLDRFGIDVDLRAEVGTLAPAVRSAVAIARSSRVLQAHEGHRLFILDEPTAYLGQRDVDRVLELVRSTAADGAAVIFISHHFAEVTSTCDRILVLRDGRLVRQFDARTAEPNDMITAMLGRPLDRFYPAPSGKPQRDEILTFDGISGKQARDVTFSLHAGEVVGVTGLIGSGYDEIPYLVAGDAPLTAGDIQLRGKSIVGHGIRRLLSEGVAVVPGNRQTDGAWMEGTARENVSLLKLRRFFRRPFLRLKAEAADAAESLNRFGVRPAAPDQEFSAFSGGNQQKIVLAKWMTLEPQVLLLDEPTQGVDAGARRDILDIIVETARSGNAVAIFSADTEQLSEMCDRVVVLVGGRVCAILEAKDATEARIVALTQGAPDPGAPVTSPGPVT
jgi:ribose transport system ATP-binding protein